MKSHSQASPDQTCDDALAAWLRGSARDASDLFAADPDRLLHRIDLHGIGPLLSMREADGAVPEEPRKALRERLIAREFWEAQHRRVVAQALDALAGAGAPPLLFKGTALAWSIYPRPAIRVRGDSDILIAEDRQDAACAALQAEGFVRLPAPGERAFRGEALFQGRDRMGRLHDIDLHWRANNSQMVARLFPYGELWERSVPLEALAPGARRTGNVDSLLIACVHRRIHLSGWFKTEVNGVLHATPDSLTWLMDLDLLTRALSPAEQRELEDRARAKGLGRIVAAGLEDARRRLGTPIPEGLTRALATAPLSGQDRYLAAGPIRRLGMDFSASEGAVMKGRFLSDLAFPSRHYIRFRYADRPNVPLSLLYLRWAVDNAGKYIARGKKRSS